MFDWEFFDTMLQSPPQSLKSIDKEDKVLCVIEDSIKNQDFEQPSRCDEVCMQLTSQATQVSSSCLYGEKRFISHQELFSIEFTDKSSNTSFMTSLNESTIYNIQDTSQATPESSLCLNGENRSISHLAFGYIDKFVKRSTSSIMTSSNEKSPEKKVTFY